MRTRPALIVATAAVANWPAKSDRRPGWLNHCLSAPTTTPSAHATDDCSPATTFPPGSQPAPTRQSWINTDNLADPDTSTTLLWPSDY